MTKAARAFVYATRQGHRDQRAAWFAARRVARGSILLSLTPKSHRSLPDSKVKNLLHLRDRTGTAAIGVNLRANSARAGDLAFLVVKVRDVFLFRCFVFVLYIYYSPIELQQQ
jgi:hypothetical protein